MILSPRYLQKERVSKDSDEKSTDGNEESLSGERAYIGDADSTKHEAQARERERSSGNLDVQLRSHNRQSTKSCVAGT